MAIIKKTLFADNLDKIPTSYTDVEPSSKYFKITELPETFTGGKNAFLIQGSEYLVPDSLIKIELKDANGDIIYHEPGEGIVSASVGGEPIVTEYYEGVSKLVSVYIYPDTAYGPCTLTILGELATYDNNGINTPVSAGDEGYYNVKWQKQINVNPSLANTTKIRFYKRPTVSISEILSPIYKIEGDEKVASAVTQSFADIKLSNLETFAGDVKRIKVFRTSTGDISDPDLIQDVLVESKELLTSYNLTGSVVGNTGIFTSEVLKTQWNTGSLTAVLDSSRVEAGVRLTGNGNFRYTQSLDLKSTNAYELNLDAFYSASTDSNLEIYLISGSTSSSIGTLIGTQPTKNLLDTTIPFKIDRDYPTASLYFSQSQGQWHVGNVSLKLSEDTAFSPDEISFVTTMPTVLGNETFNFKFEFYDVNNNFVPVAVTQSALFNGGNTNIGGTILLISSSTSQSLAELNRVSSSISGTMTVYSSSASGTIGIVSSSVSGTIGAVSSSVSGTITTLSSSVSQSVAFTLSSSLTNVKNLADGKYPGVFIDGTTVFAPVIGGTTGYISDLFTVGSTAAATINLDARTTTRKIWIGTGANGVYNDTNTNVYLDSAGKFSLGNKLNWSGTTLTLVGSIDITGGSAQTQIANAALSGSNAQTTANAASNAASTAQDAANAANDKIFTDAAGKIVKAAAPSGKGLFLSSTHLGYYNTTDFPSSPWRTYMSSSGDFFLNGAGTNGLTWNAAASTLSIDGNITARNGTFIGNITSTANISGGTITGGTIAGGTITGGTITGNTITGGTLSGATVTATTGQIGGWTLGDNKIYVPNAITLDAGSAAGDKNITFFDTSGVGRVFIKQATAFASRVSTGGLANQTANFLSQGTPSQISVSRTVGEEFTADSGKTYVISVDVREGNGLTAMTTSNSFALDAYNDIYLENTSTGARRSILSVQASLTATGEYGESFINSTTWTAVVGRTAQITITGAGERYKVVQVFTWRQVGAATPVLYDYSMVGIRWDAVVVSSFVEIIAGGIQVARDSGNYVIMSREGSSAMLQVGGEGTFTGDVTANTSDKRLKNNIRVIDNPLEKLSKINGVYFNWNDVAKQLSNKKGDIEEVGFLAQEVQSVLPHIIKPAPFDIDTKTGESISGENYLTIQYEKIVPLLVEAIKELKKEIDELKNK